MSSSSLPAASQYNGGNRCGLALAGLVNAPLSHCDTRRRNTNPDAEQRTTQLSVAFQNPTKATRPRRNVLTAVRQLAASSTCSVSYLRVSKSAESHSELPVSPSWRSAFDRKHCQKCEKKRTRMCRLEQAFSQLWPDVFNLNMATHTRSHAHA